MDIKDLSGTVIKTGLCHYGPKQYRIFLCTSTFLPGTGDYEDEPEIYHDREINGYCIWLEDFINTGHISSGAGYYEYLSEAIHAAENSSGFDRWTG